MNSRRLLRNSIQKTPVESIIAVSSIRVRSAHGNSFDHLVGGDEQLVGHGQTQRLRGLEVSLFFSTRQNEFFQI